METGLNRKASFSYSTMPSPNIPDLAKARQELPLPDNRLAANNKNNNNNNNNKNEKY